jgi:inhibitor of Bruton tyrosine kinase
VFLKRFGDLGFATFPSMSHLLWKYYLEDNVDRFRSLLANGYTTSPYASKSHGGGAGQSGSLGAIGGSPGAALGTSPRATMKNRKSSGFGYGGPGMRNQNNVLGRMELNSRDQSGLTILHRAVSSAGANAVAFALALIENPSVDIYIQDLENGWTALHRALYFGNITIARALMERDSKDSMGQGVNNAVFRVNAVIKIKDHEGNSAFDVYNATIARRALEHRSHSETVSAYDDEDDDSEGVRSRGSDNLAFGSIDADEIFAFGSNKNLTLGFGDGDDRQHPEKINLKRPDHLLYRFHCEHLHSRYEAGEAAGKVPYAPVTSVSDLPALTRNRPIIIQDVTLSKLHSAILTTDPESNLYMCGFGPGGRLGTGDEQTSFNYVCVEGGGLAGKKIVAFALGQNHSMAVSSEGEVFTWGTNTWGQLGYTLPRPVSHGGRPYLTVY